jgi:hypothetical protein
MKSNDCSLNCGGVGLFGDEDNISFFNNDYNLIQMFRYDSSHENRNIIDKLPSLEIKCDKTRTMSNMDYANLLYRVIENEKILSDLEKRVSKSRNIINHILLFKEIEMDNFILERIDYFDRFLYCAKYWTKIIGWLMHNLNQENVKSCTMVYEVKLNEYITKIHSILWVNAKDIEFALKKESGFRMEKVDIAEINNEIKSFITYEIYSMIKQNVKLEEFINAFSPILRDEEKIKYEKELRENP